MSNQPANRPELGTMPPGAPPNPGSLPPPQYYPPPYGYPPPPPNQYSQGGPPPQQAYAYQQPPPPMYNPTYAVNIDQNNAQGRGGTPRSPGAWGAQNWEIADDKKLTADIDKSIRMGFIRKVYLILTSQLLVTFGLALWFNQDKAAALWLVRNPWVLIIAAVMMCFTVCGLTCIPKLARQVPTNYIMLGVLSVAMGVILGYATGRVDTPAFAMAVGMTSAICLAISLFACQTKIDFTGFGVYGFVALILLMIFGIVASIMRNRIVQIVYATLGAGLFSFYLIMDTQKVVGGKHRKYEFSIDDYCFGALALYLDIINIFMFILQILSITGSD